MIYSTLSLCQLVKVTGCSYHCCPIRHSHSMLKFRSFLWCGPSLAYCMKTQVNYKSMSTSYL